MHTRIHIALFACLCLFTGAVPAGAQEAEEGPPAGQPSQPPDQDGAARNSRSRGGLPDDVAGLQKAAIEAYEAGEHLRFVQATMKLRNKRPYEPQYLIGMVAGTALLGRQTTAYSYMHKMQQQGLSFDFNSTEDTAGIRGTQVYDYINDLLIRAGDPLGEARVAFELPEAGSYPESIVWDPSRERFLIGTVDTGSVLAVSPTGETETILSRSGADRWWSIHGLAVDAERQRLWLATAAVPAFNGLAREDLGKSALLGFDLDSLELLERHEVPADGVPHVLGSVAVLAGGDVFVIDRALPLLYRKPLGGKALEPHLGNRELVGFRDIAVSADGSKLYVADAALGILVVAPDKRVSALLAGPETLNLGGLSGLMVSGSALLVVQNGIRPQRVMRLELDDTGMSVTAVEPIANALEHFNFPSFGTVHDGAAWYFASGNTPGANAGPVKPLVLKSPVQLEQGYATPEQRKFNEETFGEEGPASDEGR
jgi:hypothetical protein